MYSIFFYKTFWVEIRQSLFCLFVGCNAMFHCWKSSVGWSNVDCLFQHFLILWHGSFSTTCQSSFIESLAFEFVLGTLSIVATIDFATQAQHFATPEIFFKQSRLFLIMLLVSTTTCSWEEVARCIRSEAICTISRTYCFPFVFFLWENNIFQVLFRQG